MGWVVRFIQMGCCGGKGALHFAQTLVALRSPEMEVTLSGHSLHFFPANIARSSP
jgi:hypothetical protein